MTALFFLLNAVCYAGQSATGKQYAAKGGQAHIFNLSKSFSAALLFLIWLLFSQRVPHIATVPFAILYGICLAVSMHTGFMALSCGPMALTSIMAAMSLVIPFVWGLFFWHERISLFAGIGLLLLLCAIVLIHFKKQSGFSKKWLLYSLITMVANGFCSVIQKYHQVRFPGQYQVDFMLFSTAVVLLIITLKGVFQKQITLHFSGLGACSGVLNGLANFIVLLLASNESAVTIFPLISAGNVMAAWLSGVILFREKIYKTQLWGLLAGILGIILLKL